MNRMMKKLTITGLMVMTLTSVSHAGGGENGINLNGTLPNGLQFNGASLNGVSLNGTQVNGTDLNGISINGTQLNGGSSNGINLNGHDTNTSGLSLGSLAKRGLAGDSGGQADWRGKKPYMWLTGIMVDERKKGESQLKAEREAHTPEILAAGPPERGICPECAAGRGTRTFNPQPEPPGHSPEMAAGVIVHDRSPELVAGIIVHDRSPEVVAGIIVDDRSPEVVAGVIIDGRSPEVVAGVIVHDRSPEMVAA